MSLSESAECWSTSDCGGSGCGNLFVLDFTKTSKLQDLVKGAAVLGFVPFGGVSGSTGAWAFRDLTVGRLFSVHSKTGVT